MTGKRNPTIEYWRSRLAPREVVYWRYVNHNGKRYPPEYGSPTAVAALLWQLHAEYGLPTRSTRAGLGGAINVWEFATRQVFVVRPSAWEFSAANGSTRKGGTR